MLEIGFAAGSSLDTLSAAIGRAQPIRADIPRYFEIFPAGSVKFG
ncbi:hypothetical protein [Mesorhizobium sp. B1-1-8]|nr:hypothetical protein [Mesorhizobium sp. B1-1-8]